MEVLLSGDVSDRVFIFQADQQHHNPLAPHLRGLGLVGCDLQRPLVVSKARQPFGTADYLRIPRLLRVAV